MQSWHSSIPKDAARVVVIYVMGYINEHDVTIINITYKLMFLYISKYVLGSQDTMAIMDFLFPCSL
jgi:hypothetical protein